MEVQNSDLASLAELASDFRLSEVHVAKLARDGVLTRVSHPTDKRAHLYPYRENVRRYVAYLRSTELQAHEDLIRARVAQTELKTRRDLLRLELEAGLLVRKDLFYERFEPLFVSYRQTVLSRPSRLERRLARAKSREARIRILDDDARDMLGIFSELLGSSGRSGNGTSPSKKTL